MANCLVFESDSRKYAIPVQNVKSIFWMPKLSPIEGAPPWVAGLLNWHGQIIKVIDLAMRFGHSHQAYKLNNTIILIHHHSELMGLIVDSVSGLFELDLSPECTDVPGEELYSCEIKFGDEILGLLNVSYLMAPNAVSHQGDFEAVNFQAEFDQISGANKTLLEKRTHHLTQQGIEHSKENLKGFAIVDIGGIRFAIELPLIAEFTHLRSCTLLPCCPPHIIGAMNLRGEILTIVDISIFLDLNQISDRHEIVVLQLGSKRMGLAVGRVEDLYYASAGEISQLQDAGEHHIHCHALLRYGSDVAGILDIEGMHSGNLLEVNEQVI